MKLSRKDRGILQQAYNALRLHSSGQALTEGQVTALSLLTLVEVGANGSLTVTKNGQQLLDLGPDHIPLERFPPD